MLPVIRTTLVANITKCLVTGVPFGWPAAKGERLSQVKRSSRRLFGRGLPNRHRTAIAPAAYWCDLENLAAPLPVEGPSKRNWGALNFGNDVGWINQMHTEHHGHPLERTPVLRLARQIALPDLLQGVPV